MTKRPATTLHGERSQTNELAPENTNSEQRDSDSQSQTVAAESRNKATAAFGLEESEKLESIFDDSNVQDLVDHMNQMLRSGAIDMSAFAGEPNHDDDVDKYGKHSKPDELSEDET